MSRMIEVTKLQDGTYDVNPNAPSGVEAPSFSNNLIYLMKGDMNICGIMADGSFLQNESDIPDVKWWGNISGGPSQRDFYTASVDDAINICPGEYQDYITVASCYTHTNCQITYSNGTLRIYNETEGIDMTFNEHDTMPLACFVFINPTS